jgi:hypothetical protein
MESLITDYILFYAEGIDTYNVEVRRTIIYMTVNLTIISPPQAVTERIKDTNQPNGSSDISVTTFDDHQFHELDLINIAKLADNGLVNLLISSKIKNLNLILNIDVSTPVKIKTTTAAAAYTPTSFQITSNGQTLVTYPFLR